MGLAKIENMEVVHALESFARHGTVIDDKEWMISIILKLWENTAKLSHKRVYDLLDKDDLLSKLRSEFSYADLRELRELLEYNRHFPMYKFIEFLNKYNIKIYEDFML